MGEKIRELLTAFKCEDIQLLRDRKHRVYAIRWEQQDQYINEILAGKVKDLLGEYFDSFYWCASKQYVYLNTNKSWRVPDEVK